MKLKLLILSCIVGNNILAGDQIANTTRRHIFEDGRCVYHALSQPELILHALGGLPCTVTGLVCIGFLSQGAARNNRDLGEGERIAATALTGLATGGAIYFFKHLRAATDYEAYLRTEHAKHGCSRHR